MPLRTYQTPINPNTLYELWASGQGVDQIRPNIEVSGGTVDIYGSQNLPVTVPADMSLDQTGFIGLDDFNIVPRYFYLQTASGTPAITLTGISAKAV